MNIRLWMAIRSSLQLLQFYMRIKPSNYQVKTQTGFNQSFCNPETHLNKQPKKGAIFQSQFQSIQNYFSLLHHMFGRDVRAKQILKNITDQEIKKEQRLNIQITDIIEYNNCDVQVSKMIKSTISDFHHSPQKSLPKYESHRPTWKQNILRRKNNGSHGEIMKGNPKNNHSQLMNRASYSQETYLEQPPLQIQSAKQDFVPVGNMHKKLLKGTILHKRRDVKSELTSYPKSKPTKTSRIYHAPKRNNLSADNQILSRTCFPLKSSLQLSDNSMTIRKSIVSTPYRYKSRMSTPCPWDYTTHR